MRESVGAGGIVLQAPAHQAVNLRLASARWVPKAKMKQKSTPLPEVTPQLEVVSHPAPKPGDSHLV